MKIAIIGYGKMGKAVHEIAKAQNIDVPIIIGSKNRVEIALINSESVDAVIEFSKPEFAFENIRHCLENGVPIVSGTTGWLDKYEEVVKICKIHEGTFLYASNFSIGVNLFFEFNRFIAQKMRDHHEYTCEIEEIHHTQKLDAPSGTAITIAYDIILENNDLNSWINKKSEERSQLGIISKRIENIPGTHIIKYSSDIDEIELKHTAHSRKGFALGAVKAAKFVIGKKGMLSMKDMLFLS
jgi:4-hydroxy-tetrahydrodipicolinate reductase